MFKFFRISLIIVLLQLLMLKIGKTDSRSVPISEENENVNHKENYLLLHEHLKIMNKVLNNSVNPCIDFTEFACGNYVKDMYGIGMYPNIASEDYVEIAFENSNKLFAAGVKARDFYVSCKTKKSLKENVERINVLKEEEINWPILERKGLKNNFAWMRISEESKLLRIPPVLKFKQGDDNILEISYGAEFSATPLSENEINEMMEIMNEFNSDPDDVRTIINELIDFTNDRRLVYSSIASFCKSCLRSESYDIDIDVRTLKNKYSGIDWDRYLQIVFKRKFSNWEKVKMKHYLRTIPYLEFISKINDRILTNYVTWKVISELKKIDNEADNNCATLTFNKFESVLPAIYSNVIFDDYNRNQYLETLKKFKESFEQSMCRYNATSIRDLEPVFKTELEYIRNLDVVFAPETINENFKNVKIYPDNYYQNLMNLGNHKSCALHDKDCIKRINLMIFIFEIASMYNKPLYYSFTDKYFSLWEKVIQNALNRGWNSIKYERTKSCVKLQSRELKLESDGMQSIIIGATLKQTFNDYKKWLMDNEDDEREKIFNAYNLNSKKVFFVSFAQAHCNQEEKFRSTVQQAFFNMDEFSKEFKCQPNTPMNPLSKCRIL